MIKANKARLARRIDELARFGGSDQGMNRFAYTPEEKAAQDYLKEIFRDLGLTFREDAVGNIFARYEGTVPGLKPIVSGSHIDTVRNGGKYDGALGVLSILEVIETFRENDIHLKHPLDLFISKDEEGTRFTTTLFGTAAMIGKLTGKDLLRTDNAGITIRDAMQAAGYDPDQLEAARALPGSIAAYLEVHIEQGRVLENAGIPIGVVTGIAGPLWLSVTVRGEAGHAGATPMRIRHDPMIAAAELILRTDGIVRQYKDTVATTGQLKVLPGSTNVIPAEVTYTIDLRDVNMADRDDAEAKIRDAAGAVMTKYGVTVELSDLGRVDSVPCDPAIMSVIEESAKDLGLPSLRMPSGAGHDAMYIRELGPFGMIFVPSVNGYSHRADEYTPLEDCLNGVKVLAETILRLDDRLTSMLPPFSPERQTNPAVNKKP